MLVKTAGVRHLVIVVNKMDDPTVEWEEARYSPPYMVTSEFIQCCLVIHHPWPVG